MRALALILVLVAASCERAPGRSVEAEAATFPYQGLPTWAPVPATPRAANARPEPWAAGDRPTLVVFTASWCPPCTASVLVDVAVARAYGDRFRIGVGLVDETAADFARSHLARLLAGVTVWTAESVRELAVRCGAAAIPTACLVDRGRVVYRGGAVSARRVLDAFERDRRGLGARLATEAATRATAAARLALGVAPDEIDEIVDATRSDPGWQHDIALSLAARQDASATDLVLAVALARAAVAAEGGLDYAHLDTYMLALSKMGRAEDAAAVGWRVLALCRKTRGKCIVERQRAYSYIYYWQETGGKAGARG